MTDLLILLAAVSITWGIRAGKAFFITDHLVRFEFFQAMFACSYCTGFHAGWGCYLLSCTGLQAFDPAKLLLIAFSSSILNYAFDAVEEKYFV